MENPPSGVCLLVADWGIGDHYIVGGLAEAVRRQFGLRVWVAGRGNLAFLSNLYPAIERYLEWPADLDAQAVETHAVESGKIFYAHFPKLELMRAVGYNGFHFLDAYRCRLGLPVNSFLSRPRQPNSAELLAATSVLEEGGFKIGRTAVLSIEARTTPMGAVNGNFWQELAQELQAGGLDVLVNAGPSTVVPDGLRKLSLPLSALRAVVSAAGFFASVRSGLSDLICDVRCPQIVIYPEVRYWGGTLHEGTTFARFGLTKSPHEVIVGQVYTTEQVRSIAAHFIVRLPKRELNEALTR